MNIHSNAELYFPTKLIQYLSLNFFHLFRFHFTLHLFIFISCFSKGKLKPLKFLGPISEFIQVADASVALSIDGFSWENRVFSVGCQGRWSFINLATRSSINRRKLIHTRVPVLHLMSSQIRFVSAALCGISYFYQFRFSFLAIYQRALTGGQLRLLCLLFAVVLPAS